MTKPTPGNKTPYEIRLELLQLAHDNLQATFKMQMDFATQALQLAQDAHWQTADQLKKLMPVTFTAKDIIEKATEMYAFVQKKD